MQLMVKEASRLLGISERKIYNYIRNGELPAYQINKVYHINKTHLLEWTIAHGFTVSPELFSDIASSDMQSLPTLSESLDPSRIFYDLSGTDTASVLKSIIDKLPFANEEEKKQLYVSLLAREMLGSTAIGNGIAIPHVRNPIILNIKKPAITLSFLKEPIEFGALDNKKVGIFFTMLSTTTRLHLHLLARLSFVLQKESVIRSLKPSTAPHDIIQAVFKAEQEIMVTNQPRSAAE